MSILNPLNRKTTLEYDTHGNLVKKTDPYNNTTTYSDTKEQQLKSRTNALNQTSYLEYDSIGRLTKAGAKTFRYDRAGNNLTHQSKYDKLTNRLLENQTHLFIYDERGNLIEKRAKYKELSSTRYTFNELNQLTNVEVTQRGRMVKFFYYGYDALGRRVSKKFYDITKSHETVQHYYLYNRQNIVAILDKRGVALATIVHHDTKIDTPLSIHTIYGRFYYHRDHQGSIIALSDEYGDIVERIEYDDHYGVITKHLKRSDVETLNPYGFTGREIELDDLYYYRARYYDPTTQRFISRDPIGFASGDFNFYRYVGNSPLNFVDPMGFKGIDLGQIATKSKKLKELKDKADEVVDALPIDKVKIIKKGEECIEDAKAYHINDSGSIEEWADISSCIRKTELAMRNSLYDDLTPSYGIPYTDIEFRPFPRPEATDVNQTFEHKGEVFRPPNLTQEELAIERQKLYDKYGDGSETGEGYRVCQSYDYLIDKNTPDNVVENYEDQRQVCIYKASSTPNPNYNVKYKYDDSPNNAPIYDSDGNLVEINNVTIQSNDNK